MPMDEKVQRDVQISVETVFALAERGLAAVEHGRLSEAATVYDLLNDISHSLAVSLRIINANALKKELLPEDMLEIRHTGAEQPLGSGEGHYL